MTRLQGGVLVTGGAGFIGSHLVQRLLERGDRVRVLDDLSTGKEGNLEEVREAVGAAGRDRLELVRGSVVDPEQCRKGVEGAEVVFHEAALSSVPRSVDAPGRSAEVNVVGTATLLMACRAAKVRRVVFASSSSVYGEAGDGNAPKHEGLELRPISPYAVTKVASELYVRQASSLWGIEGVALRYFNVFGPRQDPESQYAAVVPRFASALLAGRSPTIYGDGEQTRDFTFVENVVEANLLAATQPGVVGEAMNVAGGDPRSVNALFRALASALGAEVSPDHAPARAGDIRHSHADPAKAMRLLGWKSTVSFEEGIRRTAAWYRSKVVSDPRRHRPPGKARPLGRP